MKPRTTVPPKQVQVPAYSRNRAAEILGWSARTLVRRTEDGVIARRPDGRFDRDEVERVLSLALSDDADLEDSEQSSVTNQSLRMFQQAQSHTERMMKLVEGPIQEGLAFLKELVASIAQRDVERDKAHLEFVKAAGELFMHKAERDAILLEAQGKADALRAVGGQLAQHAPTLLSQLTGKKLSDFDDVKGFVSMLDDDDKAGLATISALWDDPEKKAAYFRLLRTIGIRVSEVQLEEVQGDSAEKVA